MSKYYYPMKKLVYSGEHKREISMPVGGIGTGCVGLASNGALVDFKIFGRTNKTSYNGFALFAVKTEIDGEICDVRALETDAKIACNGSERMPTEYFYSGKAALENYTQPAIFPRFPESDFVSSYPFGEIDFAHEKFPGKIHLTAWNPLIPLNDTDSGIPAVFLEYRITNDTDKNVDYTFYGMLQNPCKSCVNSFCDTRNDSIKYIKLTSSDVELCNQEKREMCIGVSGRYIKYQEYLLRDDNSDGLRSLLNDIKDGDLVNRSYMPDKDKKDACAISSKVSLAPGESDIIRFIISWYTPYTEDLLNILSAESDELNNVASLQENHSLVMDDNCDICDWKNYYTRYFTGADECVYYCLSQWERLYEETDMYRQLLFSSTLPVDIIEAVSVNVAALKSPACVRIRDGSLYTIGENGNIKESCDNTCGGICNYEYEHSYLFPGIERSVITNHYKNDMDARGALSFAAKLPNVCKRDNSVPFVDAQFLDVLRVYREFKLSGKTEWLSCIWKDVVKSIEFAWHPGNEFQWDPEKTGRISGTQHHTLGSELVGANSWICGLYVCALKAAAELAAVMKDKKHTELFNSLYEKGREYLNTELYNGKYFLQKFGKMYSCNLGNNADFEKIKYQIGEGSYIQQVSGQWQSDITGLGEIFDKDKTNSALRTIYEMNFKSIGNSQNDGSGDFSAEKGVLLCAYPDNTDTPDFPFPCSDECISGFEYQVASHMIINGLVDEGLEIIKKIKNRYDGSVRNPFKQTDKVIDRTLSLATYSLLGAFSGQSVDVYNKSYRFCPDMRFAEKGVFRCMVCFENFLGFVERGIDYIQLNCLRGSIKVRKIEVPDVPLKVKCNNLEIGFETDGNTAILDNDCEVNPSRDLFVIFKIND